MTWPSVKLLTKHFHLYIQLHMASIITDVCRNPSEAYYRSQRLNLVSGETSYNKCMFVWIVFQKKTKIIQITLSQLYWSVGNRFINPNVNLFKITCYSILLFVEINVIIPFLNITRRFTFSLTCTLTFFAHSTRATVLQEFTVRGVMRHLSHETSWDTRLGPRERDEIFRLF